MYFLCDGKSHEKYFGDDDEVSAFRWRKCKDVFQEIRADESACQGEMENGITKIQTMKVHFC